MKLTRRQVLAALGLAPLAFVGTAQARPRPRTRHLYPSRTLYPGKGLYPH